MAVAVGGYRWWGIALLVLPLFGGVFGMDRPSMAPRQFPLTNTTNIAQGGVITTITRAPNFDFDFLPTKLAKWILDNHYYSIDWAHVRVANDSILFNGAPSPQTKWNKNGSCVTWWDLPEGLGKSLNESDDGLVYETIVVDAPEPIFCTSTLSSFVLAKLKRSALSEWLEARGVGTGSGGPGPVTKTQVSYLPQPEGGQQPINPGGKVEAPPDPTPTIHFDDSSPAPSPAASPNNPIPAPSPAQLPPPSGPAVDSAIQDGIAQAIASLFPGSSPATPSPNNPIPQNGNSGNTPGIGALVASAFGNLPSENSGNNALSVPQQGQVNGVPYSVGPSGIVVGGSTYSPSNPTVIALPDGHTANIGPGGLSIDNNPIIPLAGNPSSQGQVNGIPYSITPGGIVISGVTYPMSQPTSVTLPNGQTLVIGSNGLVQIGGVNLPSLMGPSAWAGAVNGINYQINPDGTIVVNGQTLNLATPTSVTLPGGKVVTIGPNGISFDGTVIPFPAGLAAAMPTAMTVAGIAFSVGPGEVIIGGKTYSFPPGATGTTIVIDGKTISIGPNGIVFPSTTVPLTHPPTTSGAAKTSTGSITSQTSSKSSETSSAPTPPKTTTKKGSAVGLRELLGSILALELLAIFTMSLL